MSFMCWFIGLSEVEKQIALVFIAYKMWNDTEFLLALGHNTDSKSQIVYFIHFQILFPGVRTDTFRQLVSYLYCDDVSQVSPSRCLDLLELANRLCLQLSLIHI